MCNWQFSDTERTSSSFNVFSTRSENTRTGVAESDIAFTSSILNSRSGIHRSHANRLFSEPLKKLVHFGPEFISTRKTTPILAQQPRQLVAAIDRREEISAGIA